MFESKIEKIRHSVNERSPYDKLDLAGAGIWAGLGGNQVLKNQEPVLIPLLAGSGHGGPRLVQN